MITHTIKPPRSGKTHIIAQSIAKKDIVISKTIEDFNNNTYIKVGWNYIGSNYFNSVERIFIDDLLSFNKHELRWLWDMIVTCDLHHKEIFAYSTPRKTFDKSFYFMARQGMTVLSDPLLSAITADIMNKGIQEIKDYMLDQNVAMDKEYHKHIKDKPDLERMERSIGWENFDLMFNLNMLK